MKETEGVTKYVIMDILFILADVPTPHRLDLQNVITIH